MKNVSVIMKIICANKSFLMLQNNFLAPNIAILDGGAARGGRRLCLCDLWASAWYRVCHPTGTKRLTKWIHEQKREGTAPKL